MARWMPLILALCVLGAGAVQGAKWLRGGDSDGACEKDDTQTEKDFGGGILLSSRPRIIYYPNFVSDREIEAILAMGAPKLRPSKTDAGLKQDIRSSIATFFTPEDEKLPEIMAVKKRAFDVTKIHYENQEELQMQRYLAPRDMQKDFYIPHYDSDASHVNKRVCTLILYLEEPEEGGETIFPMVHTNSTIRHKATWSTEATTAMAMNMWRDGICDKAARGESDVLAIKPKRGSAVLFYTLTPDGKVDPHSIHGSCPVLKGQKTVCQQWVNEAWMAPVWSPDLESMWRHPNPSKGGWPDASFHGRDMVKMNAGELSLASHKGLLWEGNAGGGGARAKAGMVCAKAGLHGAGGVLSKVGQARAFTLSTLMYLESCSEPLYLLLAAREKGAQTRVGWELEVDNCRISLWGPGRQESSETASFESRGAEGGAGWDDEVKIGKPVAREVSRGVWFHVTLVTEDLNYNETRSHFWNEV
jgi:prolyl 4-hydroxylase